MYLLQAQKSKPLSLVSLLSGDVPNNLSSSLTIPEAIICVNSTGPQSLDVKVFLCWVTGGMLAPGAVRCMRKSWKLGFTWWTSLSV